MPFTFHGHFAEGLLLSEEECGKGKVHRVQFQWPQRPLLFIMIICNGEYNFDFEIDFMNDFIFPIMIFNLGRSSRHWVSLYVYPCFT